LTVKETLTALSRALRVVVSADQFFWTANQAEMETMLLENPHTYQFDGVGFEVMGSAEDDPLLVPLWRFHETTTGTHFWTTDEHGEQFLPPFNSLPGVREGIAAHVYGAPLAGTLPVYRWWNPLTGVHFWSTDPDGENFGAAGVLEGIAFWALPSNSGVAGAIPMARARCYNCGDAAFGSSGLFVPQRGQN
jgi:hypothetical protein